MTATDLDRLDQILSSDEVLIPSSGFAAGVMEAVREAAGEPPPLPFPWLRFVAGLFACGVGSACAFVLVQQVDWSILHRPVAELSSVAPQLAYATAALCISVAFLRVRQTFTRS